ncbi:helicase-exonuclease AddAB subunit AddA [Enterococcus sp.]|uniref:helicase-exonuclease AddAB subunit AddA n=1 Tax=Enterococcus sp. TaxID=35783 RepID=UPI002FC9B259
MTNIPLKPQNETFTDTQWQAIFDEGDHLLISASAGSGKTTVLVRRVIEKLKNGVNIDELLIVTFTEAAAREMKERIQSELQKSINDESDAERRQHFVKQLTLLPMAHISTLHSFCLAVIRRYYYLIGIDPIFRLLTDETERILLKEEVWEELRDQKYEAGSEVFYRLTENFVNDRSDEALTDVVMDLHRFAQANPDPENWLENLAKQYTHSDDLSAHPLFQKYIEPVFTAQLQGAVNQIQQSLEQVAGQKDFAKLSEMLENDYAQVAFLLQSLKDKELTVFYQALGNVSFGRFPTYRKEEQKQVSVPIKEQRDALKDQVGEMQKAFAYSPEKILELMTQAQPLVEEMGQLTLTFMHHLKQRKKDKGVLEFNDLEHYALEILRGDAQEGSEASTYYRQQFKEVLVDEYQDVNRLQEAILSWVRTPDDANGNQFMVGDVKQSIYAFRLADPTLFIDKYLAYEKQEGGRRIILADNFRSRHEVLHFTNLIFQQLMNEELGQIPYDQAAQLVPGFPNFPESEAFVPELLIYEKENEESNDEGIIDDWLLEDKTDGELHLVALKIKELVDSKFQIYDKKLKENRPVTYRDIVLLTPTRKNNLMLLDIFKKFEIPLEINDAQNYFQATEIQTMIALLQLIDNPYQDIPLAAVLRSPIVGLNEQQLVEIRLLNKASSYYEAFLMGQKLKTPLGKKINQFMTQLDAWREKARRVSIAELLWEIYEETAYLDYVIGLPSGRQRYANLIALVNRAEMYETSSFRGLYQFIRFIEKIQEKEKDLAQPFTQSVEDAVKLMTIHGSKGLEFPVVFILDMNKRFNNQDLNGRFVLEEQLGAGIQLIDEERIRYETLPYQVIKQVRLEKALSEEMRKLYVALTRSEQKLYLVGSYKNKADALKQWSQALNETEPILNRTVRYKPLGNLMNWIGMTLIRHPQMQTFFDDEIDPSKKIHHPGDFKIDWWNEEKIKQATVLLEEEQTIVTEEVAEVEEDLAPVFQVLEFKYPLEKSTMTTSYQSVSEIKRLYNDPDEKEITKLAWESTFEQSQKQQYRYVNERLNQPKFMQEQTVDGAAIGSATHTFLQLLPLTMEPDLASLQVQMKDFVAKNQLDESLAKKIPLKAILWFFATDLGKEILANPSLVKREQPFSMLKDAQDVYLDFNEKGAELLIHGMIDGYIEYEDHVILYDFKTDTVIKDEEAFVQSYQGQLRLYKEALEEALNKPVQAVYLIALSAQKIISLQEKSF